MKSEKKSKVLDLLKLQEIEDFNLPDIRGNEDTRSGIELLSLESEIWAGYEQILDDNNNTQLSTELTKLRRLPETERTPSQNSRIKEGVEILGLGYVIQQAGARAAIATLWQVSDESTQTLMSAFYELVNNKKDITTAEALRQAQIRLIESSDRNHPYYWAAFLLIGNGL